MMHTKSVSKNTFSHDLTRFLQKIESCCMSNSSNSLYFAADDTPVISKYALNTVRMIPVNSREENIFKQIVVEYLIKSEKVSGFSSPIFLSYLLDLITLSTKKKIGARQNTESIKEKINKCLEKPQINDLKKFLSRNFDEIYSSAVFESLKSFGLNGKIEIKRRKCDQVIVEVTKGYSFICTPDENLIYLSKGKYERENVKCFVIDGIIEKVSEIDRILNYAAKTSEPIALFCRGYTEEVLSTIMTNNMRGTIDVLLVTSKINENSANDLADICACTGGKFYSVFGGDLITSIDPEENISIIDSLTATSEKIVICNEKTEKRVKRHVGEIIKKNYDNLDSDYYKNRIRNLTGHACTIYIPEKNEQKNVFMTSNFDMVLRVSKSVISKGLVSPEIFENEEKITFPGIKKYSNYLPAESVYVGVEMAFRCFEKISSIEKIISIED
jgi:hypothetical protein